MTEVLEDIEMLRPGKNAQIAAKKISKKYQKTRSRKRKLVDEVDPAREKKYRKLTDLNEERKTKHNIESVSKIRGSAARKITPKKYQTNTRRNAMLKVKKHSW